jgi:UDP-glucose 4-epimerase
MNILIAGGTGCIASLMVKQLGKCSASVVVLDDLSSGYRDAEVAGAELVVGSALYSRLLAELFGRHRFDAVMHFASLIQVGESVFEPENITPITR